MPSTILSDNGVSSGSAGLKTTAASDGALALQTTTAGKACSVYWLRLPEHTDMFVEGYVGISEDAEARWKWHRKSKENPHLKAAIKKYGFDNLVKQIVLVSNKEYCLDIERKLRPSRKIGWNIAIGGGKPPAAKNKTSFAKGFTPWNKGVPMDDETKAKVSAAKMGASSWNKGVPMSEEAKAKLSAAKKGKLPTPDAVEKMAAANRGKKRPKWVVEKIMAAKKRNQEIRDLAKEVT